jgi:hypothetical protein
MKLSLMITFIAFCFLFLSLLISRIKLEHLKTDVEEIKGIIEDMDFK